MTETKRLRSARLRVAGSAQAAVVGGHEGSEAAAAGRRVTAVGDHRLDLGGGGDLGDDDAGSAGVEDRLDRGGVGGLHAHEDGAAAAPGHHQVGAHRLRPHGGVLQVDPQEVDHVRQGLADLGIGEGQGGAHQGLAGLEPAAEVVDAVEDHGANGSRSHGAGKTDGMCQGLGTMEAGSGNGYLHGVSHGIWCAGLALPLRRKMRAGW